MKHEKQELNRKINSGSMAVGFLLALGLILATGASSSYDDSPGRYQCCAAGADSAVFVIDTQTGHTWRFSRTDTYDFGTPQARRSVRRSITPMID